MLGHDVEREMALNESIDHWHRLKAAVGMDDWREAEAEGWSSEDCALCDLYARPVAREEAECKGCPVAQARQPFCATSPYIVAAHAISTWMAGARAMDGVDADYDALSPRFITKGLRHKALAAVTAELEFLESLRTGE